MKTYIWTLPTRIFHWLLAIAFTIAYILGGDEKYINLHAGMGIFIGVLVFSRVLQGVFGPRYAQFSDFPVSINSIRLFLTKTKQSKASHPGHNPLASLIMLSIFLMALLSAISGMLIFASGDSGIFGLRLNPGTDPEMFEEIHEIVANLFLFFVGIHLMGILLDTLFHNENGTIWSIFTGYKRIIAIPASTTIFHKMFSFVWFTIPFVLLFYMLLYHPMPGSEKDNMEQVYDTDNDED